MSTVTILIPTYNEEAALPDTIARLQMLDPPPDQIVLVDGGSEDHTVELADAAGLEVLLSPKKGRGAQINHGVAQANSDIVCVLHADSALPEDAIEVIRDTMDDRAIALASFTPRVAGEKGTRWGSTFHNWIKTWYAPLLCRPDLFLRRLRLLYGDHAMFFRKEDFEAVGGCDETLGIMEDATLCVALARRGRVKLVPRWVWTSDRRIAKLGRWRANWIYFKVTMLWAMGTREKLADHYPDIR